ncbi:MAG: hypothetical protein HKN76_18005 [Saprospiraceae bacterium]|nr:hypothetical protein [Saprospiraceae bacterium]
MKNRIQAHFINLVPSFVLGLVILSFFTGIPEVKVLIGTGSAGTSNGPALTSKINNPFGVVRGPAGDIWFCEYDGHTVRKMNQEGIISTIVGTGTAGYSGDGGPPIAATLFRPHEIRFDRDGNLFIADMSNHVIRKVNFDRNEISTVAGTGHEGFSGDGGLASLAQLRQPHSIQFDPQGHLYIADVGNNRIRLVNMATGMISTFAGTGAADNTIEGSSINDIALNGPRSIDFDRDGDLWLVLRNANQVWRFDMINRTVHHIAGNGIKGFTGNGGDARLASLSGPKGITIAPSGLVYIADTESHTIRMINPDSGTIYQVVGTGTKFDGEDGDPLRCGLARPHGVFADKDGSVLIGDSENHKIRVYRP